MLVPPGAVRRPTAREVDAGAGVAVVAGSAKGGVDRIATPLVSAGKEKGAGAALIQGGLCIAGDDIVVNRLMGRSSSSLQRKTTRRPRAARGIPQGGPP